MTETGDHPAGDRPVLTDLVSVPTRRPGSEPFAADVDGVDTSGARVCLLVTGSGRPLLLLFLGARCDGCRPFWPIASDPPALGLGPDGAVAIVSRPPPQEDPAVLRDLLPDAGVTLVLSEGAWGEYRVQGPPFYALVEAGRVVTEGVAWSVEYVAADVRRARQRTSTSG